MNDKLLHFLIGVGVALFAAGIWWLLATQGAVSPADAWAGAMIGAVVAGITKEGADYLDNRSNPGMHGVEALDALATAAGCVPVVILLRVVG